MKLIRKMLITVLGGLVLTLPLSVTAFGADASTVFGQLNSEGKYVLENKTYTLTEDLTSQGRIVVPAGVTAVVDLAGHTIDRNLDDKYAEGGSVFGVESKAQLTVKNGTVRGGARANGNGGGFNVNGTLILDSVSVEHCKAGHAGGGIFINQSGASAELKGNCSVRHNKAGTKGSGIYVGDGCTITIGGKAIIEDNSGSNLYTIKGSKVIVDPGLNNDSKIGVTQEEQGREKFAEFNKESSDPAETAKCFKNDTDNSRVQYRKLNGTFWFVFDFINDTGKPVYVLQYQLMDKITGNGKDGWLDLNDSEEFYFVRKDTVINDQIRIFADVSYGRRTIILCDGATLTCNEGIIVKPGATLNIFAQKKGDMGGAGKLIAKGGKFYAGIGGANEEGFGIVQIYGGNIQATGGASAAGIGSAFKGKTGTVNIYGGNITAVGGNYGAGIGGGEQSANITVNIAGGIVNATGGDSGAGIGSGRIPPLSGKISPQGKITISGGTVTAKGGDDGAGIGGGHHVDAENVIEITGGKVTATGGKGGAGVGSESKFYGQFKMTGGELTAYGPKGYPAIGGTNDASDKISLGDDISVKSNGKYALLSERVAKCQTKGESSAQSVVTVSKCTHKITYTVDPKNTEKHIKKCAYCNLTAVSEDHDQDGTGVCRKCGFDTGVKIFTVTIKQNNTDGSEDTRDGGKVVFGRTYTVPACDMHPANKEFDCWKVTSGTGSEQKMKPGDTVRVSGDITVTAQYRNEKYSINYVLNGGSNDPANPDSYDAFTPVELKDAKYNDEIFGGWYDNPSFTGDPVKILSGKTGDITLYASWPANYYKVIYDGTTCTSGHMDPQVITFTETKNLRKNEFKREFTTSFEYNGATGGDSYPTKTACAVFDGWAVSPNGGVKYADEEGVIGLTDKDKANVTLYAVWQDVGIALPRPSKTGSFFGGWYKDQALTQKVGDGGDTFIDTVGVTLYAKWNEKGAIQPTVTMKDWTYGDEPSSPVISGNTGESLVTYSYKPKNAGDGAYSATLPTTPGEYTVRATVKATEEYQGGTAFSDFKMLKRPVTISGIKAKDKEFDATDDAELDTSEAVFSGKVASDTLELEATGKFADMEIGKDRTVTITLTLGGADKDNYFLTEDSQKTATASISKGKLADIAENVSTRFGTTGNIDIEGYIAEGENATVSEPYSLDTDQVLDGPPSYDAQTHTLSYRIKNDPGVVGKQVPISVTIETPHYEDYAVGFIVTAIAKTPQNIRFEKQIVNKKYEDADFTIALSGAQTPVTYSSSNINAANVDENGKVSVYGVAENVVITASAAETEEYGAATASFILNIDKADIAPDAPANTMNVPETTTTVGQIKLADGWVWADGSIPIPQGGEVSATANYTKDIKDNYKIISVMVRITSGQCEHTLSAVDRKEPTCQETGNIKYWHCSKCNHDFADKDGKADITLDITGKTELDKVDHSYEVVSATEPTCEREGVTSFKCKYCDSTKTENVPALGHEYDKDNICIHCGQTNPGRKFMITFDSDGGEAVAPQYVDPSQPAVKPSNPKKEGNKFVEWQLDGKAYDFGTPVTSDLTLVAKWKPNDLTVTFDSAGGTAINPVIVKYGDKVAEPAEPTRADGKEFIWWLLDWDYYDFDTPVTSDITLVADWDVDYFLVTFDSAGGTPVEDQIIDSGDTAVMPAVPTKSGSTFKGWFKDGDTNKFNFSTPITADTVLKAQWETKEHTVTFDSAGGSKVASQTVKNGDKVIKPDDPTRKNIEFIGWTYNGKPYDFETPVTSDITLVANWNTDKFTVTFDPAGGSDVPAQQVEKGGKATEPAVPTRKGFNFVGWFGNDGKQFKFSTKITADITLTAKWEEIKCTVTFDSRGGTPVEPRTVSYGQTVAEPVTTSDGFVFGGWMLNGSLYNFTTPVTKNITLTAKWEAVTHTVTFMLDGIKYSTTSVRHNERVHLPKITVAAGKTVTCWCTDEALTNMFTGITPVVSDLTLYAQRKTAAKILKNGEPFEGGLPEAVKSASGNYTAFTITEDVPADKLSFPKASVAGSIEVDAKGNALTFGGAANIKPDQRLIISDTKIKAEKNSKAQGITVTAAKGGMVLDDVEFTGKSVKINATKGDLTLGRIVSNSALTVSGNKKTKLVIEDEIEASSITGFGTIIVRDTVTITKALNVGTLIIEDEGELIVAEGATVTVKDGIDGYGEISLMGNFKPLAINGSAKGSITLTTDSQLSENVQMFKSKLPVSTLAEVFDYSDNLPTIRDGSYECGLYSKSGKVYLRALSLILNGQPYCEWNDMVNAINKAKNANAQYTLELRRDIDLSSGLKLPGKNKYASLKIDGTTDNFTITFKGKSASLTGDMTLDNVTVKSLNGAWTLKKNGFALNDGGAQLPEVTIK